MTVEGSFNFRRMSDNLTTSGVVGAERLGELSGQGYAAVINLLPDDSEWAVAEEASIVRDQGLGYHYIPVTWNEPLEADLNTFTELLDGLGGKKVHVHCAANFRVTAFYGIYGVRKGLLTADEAEALIADVWNTADHPPWKEFVAEALGTG